MTTTQGLDSTRARLLVLWVQTTTVLATTTLAAEPSRDQRHPKDRLTSKGPLAQAGGQGPLKRLSVSSVR